MVKEIMESDAPIMFKERPFADVPTFKTLTGTLSDRSSRQRPPIPTFSLYTTTSPTALTAAERRDASQVTAVDGYTGPSGSNAKADLPPTPSTSGFTAATTVGRDGRMSIQGPAAPTLVEESLNEKADANASSDGTTVVASVESDPYRDANADMSDQLEKQWAWWVLEFVPFWQYYQDAEGHWHKGLR